MKARSLLVPFLLILVALLQIYRAHALQQSPWRGGGFGMFASIDAPSNRFVRCYLLTASGEIPAALPPEANPLVAKLQVVPAPKGLARLAALLAQNPAWIEKQIEAARQQGSLSGEDVNLEAIRLEVCSQSFDASDLKFEIRRLAQAEFHRK
ncbi:MAG TPA: hypothetical protein VLU25_16960 [Acidobacteriota bacterium]|nr:hypothetical protein [Acidobacteriota bacterium]